MRIALACLATDSAVLVVVRKVEPFVCLEIAVVVERIADLYGRCARRSIGTAIGDVSIVNAGVVDEVFVIVSTFGFNYNVSLPRMAAEVWDDEASHKASLKLPSVQGAIAKGRPLIARFDHQTVTQPVGGHGLAR